MTGMELLKQQFNGHVSFRERRPGIVQVLAPLFHEDGDMVDIFLDETADGSNKVRICDHGLTLMRLSYSYDLDTNSASSIAFFQKIGFRNRTDGFILKPNRVGYTRLSSSSPRPWPRSPAWSTTNGKTSRTFSSSN